MKPWKQYQEDAASFFRSLGFEADTDVPIKGARGLHKVDVAVRTSKVGVDQLWVVECKLWKTRVRKQEFLTHKAIIDDVGADRGILLSEEGFQSGAIRSAEHTNVSLRSLADLRENAEEDLLDFGISQIESKIIRANETLRKLVRRTSFSRTGPTLTFLGSVDADSLIDLSGRVSSMRSALDYVRLNRFPVILAFLPYKEDERVNGTQELIVKGSKFMDWAEGVLMAQVANATERLE